MKSMVKGKPSFVHIAVHLVMRVMLITVLFIFLPARVYAVPDEPSSNVDFVLVLDCSGSMIDNDPDKLTIQAAKYLISQLPVENSRLAVIVFGEDYGEYHYDLGISDLDDCKNRVRVVYELNEISSEEEREKAQAAVDTYATSDGELTPMGYAVETAVRVLNSGNAETGKAAIILISDGQIDGQRDIAENSKDCQDFISIDSATARASEKKWPIYCMELNYKGENRKGEGLPGIAYHQMRENIPSKTGTEPIELKGPDQAKEEMVRILGNFFDSESGPESIKGEMEKVITISDIVAEQNINILGDMSKVTSIELADPNGEVKTYENSPKQYHTNDVIAAFDESSAYIKLIMPQEGDWRLTVHTGGEEEYDFELFSIAIREMQFNLRSSNPGGEIPFGTEEVFEANFSYQEKNYISDEFYAKTEAYLVIEGTNPDKIRMQSDGSVYRASYVFDKNGAYYVHASVESSFFREGMKKSAEEYTFTVDAKETVTQGEVEEQTIKVCGESLELDMSPYFLSLDGAPLKYSAVLYREGGTGSAIPPLADFIPTTFGPPIKEGVKEADSYDADPDYRIDEEGTFWLRSGSKSGEYVARVGACDGSGEKEVYQDVKINIENSPLRFIGDGTSIDIVLSSSGDDEFELLAKDYFEDADGTTPAFTLYDNAMKEKYGLYEESEESCITITQETGRIVIRGKKPGKSSLTLHAVDGNDEEVFHTLVLKIKVRTWIETFLNRYGKLLIGCAFAAALVIAVLAFIFGGRKIYGEYRISFPDGSQNPYPDVFYGSDADDYGGGGFEISRLRHCKGRSVKLDTVLSDIGREGGFGPRVKLTAGDKWSRKVYLKGINELDSCVVDGNNCRDKKAAIKKFTGEIILTKESKGPEERKALNVKIERIR